MSELQVNSMATLVDSLSKSFIQVPPSAIPAMLDCILLSTGLSPPFLFDSLTDEFPRLLKDIIKEDEKLDSDKCLHLMSLVGAFCHLLKKIEANHDAVQSFTWRCFLPLAKVLQAFQSDLLNQIAELFIDVLIETRNWVVLEGTLVPIVLRSVGLSMGMLHAKDSDFLEWRSRSCSQVSYDLLTNSPMDKEILLSYSSCFTLPTSCQFLSVILEAAFQCHPTVMEDNGCSFDNFVRKMIWELCNMTERMLLYSPEHRSCAVGFLLPITFRSFASNASFSVTISGQEHPISREQFFIKLWKCCRTLFSIGPSERREAYNVLSLYFSFLPHIEELENSDTICRMKKFDIRSEKEFWDEIKRGLVDKESLVRKQSLHILKVALNLQGGTYSSSSVSKGNPSGKTSIPHGVTKRELWAYKEARSLGVGNFLALEDLIFSSKQYWEAFLLLYEMLEEYGTHLVEAAWNHQVSLLIQFSSSYIKLESNTSEVHQSIFEKCGEIFDWLSILWERGLHHDNPQVRCLIMQSFLDINWEDYGSYVKSVPETFVFGPFMQGLNDPIQHKEFGVKGVYMSRTIEGAARFLCQYASCLSRRKCIEFLCNLASTAKHQSFGRAGLVGLAECIASAATGIGRLIHARKESDGSPSVVESSSEMTNENGKTELLDVLRYVIESSKQHFNPNYRLRVCQKLLEAAVSVVCTFDISLEIVMLFISALPREFTDYGGPLRATVQRWFLGCGHKDCCTNCCSDDMKLWKSLYDFPHSFVSHQLPVDASLNYDDEDLSAWELEANRWARVLFLATKKEYLLGPILMFVQSNGIMILKQNHDTKYIPVKFLVLSLSIVLELQRTKERVAEYSSKARTDIGINDHALLDDFSLVDGIYEKFVDRFIFILEDMVQFANQSCSIFWSGIVVEDTALPGSVKGKLGGPSQRRLSISTTTVVLQAIMSVKAISLILSWCSQVINDASLGYAFSFLWQFFWRTTKLPPSCSEIEAEMCLAAYEALVFVLRVLASSFFSQSTHLIEENKKLLLETGGRPLLDSMLESFIHNINNLLAVGFLARTRMAVLLDWKWMCMESLLSIPAHALKSGLYLEEDLSFLDGNLRCIFNDLVESLENAGESSVLTMLRSVRMVLELVAQGKSSAVLSHDVIDSQMMWHLVHSSWILHVSCNKRRVASIAALLSSVLHSSVFNEESMHETDNAPGPLKWFIANLLEEGTKSPRTIRLAALHLTGLWLSNPGIIKFYLKELKLLTLYGSVAFDEDFEGELADNNDARVEVSLLARSPDPELTEAFINTELYARVSVAVLFHKLADLAKTVKPSNLNSDCIAALSSGKFFLLELLDSAVNDRDLAKELYKKYSAIHRRKIRVWQMICVLAPFVEQDIVKKVVDDLCLSLNRNNLPAVRQYLETFAINIYLKFPSLVRDQLVPILRNYDTRPQALSSYVFIAANVILHSSEDFQSKHLVELFPPLVPLLTSHHHSLRGFTQLLLYQILHKLFPLLNFGSSEILPLEKRCFVDLKTYLAKNSDCARLRASMEGYLDAYNPKSSVNPAGIFINRVEEVEFECVPTSLMDQVTSFLNDVREDLRCSMAKDVVTIRNESLRIEGDVKGKEIFSASNEGIPVKDTGSDFQKKVTLAKHEMGEVGGFSFGNEKSYRKIAEMEEDDLLLDQLLLSRRSSLEQLKASRQNFILVASLLDRIPNLAGLARTCEVFRASGLTVADTNILKDKQFQLISVTAEKWVPIVEVPVSSVKAYLQKKKREGFSILGLEQTANSIPLDQFKFPKKTVLVLGREKEGIPVDIIHILDACIEIPQLGVVRSLNVHVSGAIATWEYTRQQRSQ